MNVIFRKSFVRDLKRIEDQTVLARVAEAIEQLEAAANLQEISNLKKMSGTENYYRLRIGNYRIGVTVEKDLVEFVRCLHRRDLYRFFP